MRQKVYEIKQADYDALPSDIHKLVAQKMIHEGKIKIIDSEEPPKQKTKHIKVEGIENILLCLLLILLLQNNTI